MEVKVMTFNLRMPVVRDGINYFFNRAPYILDRVQKEKPDIIGFQEAKEPIYDWLKATFTDYLFVGLGRQTDFSDEANPIAFRKDRFELFGYDQIWLSPTPYIPGSRYEEQSLCPRILVATKLKEKGTSRVIRFYNTHLDHVGAGARLLGARQILSYIEKDLASFETPFVLTGDMNATPDEISIRALLEHPMGLEDTTALLKRTFHSYSGKTDEGDKIDYIFTKGFTVTREAVCWTESFNGVYYSDHYPVEVILETTI